MARIKYGSLVVAGSGKIGGHVLSRNAGGAYIRTKVTPINPQTIAQTKQRANFAQITTSWGSLTDAQRSSFVDAVSSFAKTDVFGDLKTPTGKALYQRLNLNLLNTGQTLLTQAPLPDVVLGAEAVSADAGLTAQFMTITTNGDTTGNKVIIYATDKLSQGTTFVKNKLRQLVVFAGQAAGAFDFWAEYLAKYSIPVVGDNIRVAIRTVNAVGQVSPLQVFKVKIVA